MHAHQRQPTTFSNKKMASKWLKIYKFPQKSPRRTAQKIPNLIVLMNREELRRLASTRLAGAKKDIFLKALDYGFKQDQLLNSKQFQLAKPEDHPFSRDFLLPQANQSLSLPLF